MKSKFNVGDLVMCIKRGNIIRTGAQTQYATPGMIGEVIEVLLTIVGPPSFMYGVQFTGFSSVLGENLLRKVEPPDDDGETVPEVKELENA